MHPIRRQETLLRCNAWMQKQSKIKQLVECADGPFVLFQLQRWLRLCLQSANTLNATFNTRICRLIATFIKLFTYEASKSRNLTGIISTGYFVNRLKTHKTSGRCICSRGDENPFHQLSARKRASFQQQHMYVFMKCNVGSAHSNIRDD